MSLKVANLQGKLQRHSIHANRMKQPSPTPCPQALVTEPPCTEHTQLADSILSRHSSNTTPDTVEVLQELNPLPDFMNSTPAQYYCSTQMRDYSQCRSSARC